jgi:hypothetical protein
MLDTRRGSGEKVSGRFPNFLNGFAGGSGSDGGPGLAPAVIMRNLGLALALSVMMLAPHAVEAKKHAPHKRPRSTRAAKAARRARVKSLPGRETDELVSAVAAKRAQKRPIMTSAAVPAQPSAPLPVASGAIASASTAAPLEANAPFSMSNQILDEEVPGSKKHK